MPIDESARLRAVRDQIANALQPAVVVAGQLQRPSAAAAQDAATGDTALTRAITILKTVQPERSDLPRVARLASVCYNSHDMRRVIAHLALSAILAGAVACHHEPVIGGGPRQPVGGTISGIVSATGGSMALPSRKVTVIEVGTNARYETTTAANGGYTIQVPEGTYRLEVELRPGETLEKRPPETRVNNSDLDADRDFVVTIRP